MALRDASTASDHTLEALWRAATPVSINKQSFGIHRSTAWTIIKATHKLGRLSRKTTVRILANPDTPPSVRAVVQRYLAERSIGAAKHVGIRTILCGGFELAGGYFSMWLLRERHIAGLEKVAAKTGSIARGSRRAIG
jgi:hypothetical protein